MSEFNLGAIVGWFCGAAVALMVFSFFDKREELIESQSIESLARDFDAYRVCIQDKDCDMTAKDYIRYYEIRDRMGVKNVE